MYSKIQLGFKYLNYCLTAFNGKGHGMHSPFVFDFITKVLNDKTEQEDYERVETVREKLLQDHRLLKIEELGAGSTTGNSNQRTVKSIAKHAAKQKKYGQLLYRIVKYYQPKTIIELGTSLGLSTSYLSLAKPGAKIFTLEGSPEIANVAQQNFRTLELQNIQLIEGHFDNTLPAVLYQIPMVDLVFIDGNHRKEPTENYFHWLLSKIHNDSILIFDDIHWSKEMEEAWEHVKSHLAVRYSIDLFFLGLVFFRREFKGRQHFKIRF